MRKQSHRSEIQNGRKQLSRNKYILQMFLKKKHLQMPANDIVKMFPWVSGGKGSEQEEKDRRWKDLWETKATKC